jgi:hypothetical protein
MSRDGGSGAEHGERAMHEAESGAWRQKGKGEA